MRRLELVVVLIIMAMLAALLLQRLGESSREARRVQVRMAAENARLQGLLLQLRCSEALQPTCWQRLGATPGLPATEAGLLLAVAQAAGLSAEAGWRLQPAAGLRLQVALQGVSDCRIELARGAPGAAVRAVHVEDVC